MRRHKGKQTDWERIQIQQALNTPPGPIQSKTLPFEERLKNMALEAVISRINADYEHYLVEQAMREASEKRKGPASESGNVSPNKKAGGDR